ncbi:DUF6596 domain-containing protein [Actinoplanes sp. NPDC051411]|uniref:DUF6596 domain-containing protein n=1 Tax=Actinoplanes sp. NPDC051411 TaxID=3155522 RepID=UPI00343FB5CC
MIYLLFNEGYGGSDRRADDAEFLASLLHGLVPAEPEVAGLLALIRLHRPRAAARFSAAGEIIQLPDQDRTLWDHSAIEDAGKLIVRAAAARRPGPTRFRPRSSPVTPRRRAGPPPTGCRSWFSMTCWVYLAPSVVTRLHRAIALRYVRGPAAALGEVDALADDLSGYHLFHATRAELLRALGRMDEARAADEQALGLTRIRLSVHSFGNVSSGCETAVRTVCEQHPT